MTIKLSELIEQAHSIWLAHPTTTALARDAEGNSVDPTDESATSWCAIGAMYKVSAGAIGALYKVPVGDYFQVNLGRAMMMRAIGGAVSTANDEGWLTSDHWRRAVEYARELEELPEPLL